MPMAADPKALLLAGLERATEEQSLAALRALHGLDTVRGQRLSLLEAFAYGSEPVQSDWDLWLAAGVLTKSPDSADEQAWLKAQCATARASKGALGRGKKGTALLVAQVAVRYGFGVAKDVEAERVEFSKVMRQVNYEWGEHADAVWEATEAVYGEEE